jgi:hypothetical protein
VSAAVPVKSTSECALADGATKVGSSPIDPDRRTASSPSSSPSWCWNSKSRTAWTLRSCCRCGPSS